MLNYYASLSPPAPRPYQEEAEPHHCDHGRVLEMYQQEKKKKDDIQQASRADLVRRMYKLRFQKSYIFWKMVCQSCNCWVQKKYLFHLLKPKYFGKRFQCC